jgi:hypothetical protein
MTRRKGELPMKYWIGSLRRCLESAFRLVGFCAPLALGSCAATNVGSDYKVTPQSSEGVVTGSVTYGGDYSAYRVHYRQVGGGKSGTFQTGAAMVLLPVPDPGDFQGGGRGTVFAAALPPGEYEVYRWTLGSGYASASSTAPFSIRFSVEPGKLVYLGNFHFVQTSRMGLTVTGARLVYRDALARDLPVLKRKFPGLAETPVARAVDPATVVTDLGGNSDVRISVPVFVPSRR